MPSQRYYTDSFNDTCSKDDYDNKHGEQVHFGLGAPDDVTQQQGSMLWTNARAPQALHGCEDFETCVRARHCADALTMASLDGQLPFRQRGED